MYCAECGQAFTHGPGAVTHHLDEAGQVDHDQDRRHVPFRYPDQPHRGEARR